MLHRRVPLGRAFLSLSRSAPLPPQLTARVLAHQLSTAKSKKKRVKPSRPAKLENTPEEAAAAAARAAAARAAEAKAAAARALIAEWDMHRLAELRPAELEQLRGKTLRSVSELNSGGLARVIHHAAKAKTGFHELQPMHAEWLHFWEEMQAAASALLKKNAGDAFKSTDLFDVVWAFGEVRYAPRDLFTRATGELVPLMEKASLRKVASTLWSYALLNIHAPELFTAAGVVLSERIEELSPADCATVLWAFAAADHSRTPLFSSPNFIAFLEHAEFRTPELQQIAQWTLWSEHRDLDHMHQLPRLIREQTNVYGLETHKCSALHQEVVSTLKSIDLPVKTEVPVAAGYSLDCVVTYRGGEIAIEVDGPQHFLTNNISKPTGATLLKRRQVRHLGWSLLAVPYFEFQAAKCKKSYLLNAIKLSTDDLQQARERLGVTPDMTEDELKAVYRKFALKYHPDRFIYSSYTQQRIEDPSAAFKQLQEDWKLVVYNQPNFPKKREKPKEAAQAAPRKPKEAKATQTDSEAQDSNEQMSSKEQAPKDVPTPGAAARMQGSDITKADWFKSLIKEKPGPNAKGKPAPKAAPKPGAKPATPQQPTAYGLEERMQALQTRGQALAQVHMARAREQAEDLEAAHERALFEVRWLFYLTNKFPTFGKFFMRHIMTYEKAEKYRLACEREDARIQAKLLLDTEDFMERIKREAATFHRMQSEHAEEKENSAMSGADFAAANERRMDDDEAKLNDQMHESQGSPARSSFQRFQRQEAEETTDEPQPAAEEQNRKARSAFARFRDP